MLGISDDEGRIKPSRQSKYRQVEEFLRLLDSSITEAIDKGHLRRPTVEDPLRIVDLGCGNAYLTFAAERYLTGVRKLPVRLTGVDVKEQSREHNSAVAAELGVDAEFVVGTIGGVELDPAPEVVLALHACDTATDEALAQAVGWGAQLVLAAPCCHHDIAAQMRKAPTPSPYAMLTRHGILRERLADTLTDGLRASLMRLQGYRVDVVQFVESQHTPRNTMLRAVRTGGPVKGGSVRKEYDELVPPGASTRSSPSSSGLMLDRVLGLASALSMVVGTTRRPGRADGDGRVHLPGPGDRRVQRAGRHRRALPDGQRLRRQRPGLRGRRLRARRSASPRGPTTRPTSSRSPRPARARCGWATPATTAAAATRSRCCGSVRGGRPEVTPAAYELVYPDRAHDAETLMADPGPASSSSSPRTSSAARSYAAPRRLSADHPNRLRAVADGLLVRDRRVVLPRRPALRRARLHSAAVYTFPGHEQLGLVPAARSRTRARGSRSVLTTGST